MCPDRKIEIMLLPPAKTLCKARSSYSQKIQATCPLISKYFYELNNDFKTVYSAEWRLILKVHEL